jgi:multidrug resistance efflux pump
LRQQVIEAPVYGRVAEWDKSEIYEGAHVKKGQRILEIRDVDPNLRYRLDEQLEAARSELSASERIVIAYEQQVEAYRTARDEIVAAADEYIEMAQQKVAGQERSLEAAQAAEIQKKLNFERKKLLEQDGLASTYDREFAEREWKEAVAKVEKAKADLEGAKDEEQAKRKEREAKSREASAKIESANAQQQKAEADVAKARKQVSEIEVKVARQNSQVVTAPVDGFILRLYVANQGAQLVKQGDPLLEIVPDTQDRAVEIWLDGNDAPLVEPGRHVRLQFEGWPAVQFAGWPSVAVGTFGGTVASIDSTDVRGDGRFRALIVPDESEQTWPDDRYLRQGVRANGWVLLNEVGLGYEIWRKLNGFPPVVSQKEPKASGAKFKAGKPK